MIAAIFRRGVWIGRFALLLFLALSANGAAGSHQNESAILGSMGLSAAGDGEDAATDLQGAEDAAAPEGEEPPREMARKAFLDTANLIENGVFTDWHEYGPQEWSASQGSKVARSPEGHDGKIVVEWIPRPRQAECWFLQELRVGLPDFLRPGDLLHADALIKCAETDNVFLGWTIGYEVDNKIQYAHLKEAAKGDSEWHRIRVEWQPAKEALPQSPKLTSVFVAIRVATSANEPTPIYISDAHAWLVNPGL